MASPQVSSLRPASFDKFDAAARRSKVGRTTSQTVVTAAASAELNKKFVGWSTAAAEDDGEPLQLDGSYDLSLPVIDLGGLTSSSVHGDLMAARLKIVREIGRATEEWGFFQVVNHGVSEALVESLHSQARQFFQLPLDVRKRAEICDPNNLRMLGYNETFAGPGDKIPMKESLADFSSPSSPVTDLAAKIWDGGNSAFSTAVEEHCKAAEALGQQLLELLAESVGLKRNFFSRHFQKGSDCIGTWRLHHFPAHAAPSSVWRTVSHSDPSVLTILKQDIGGLQVKKPGESIWVDVKPLPGSFVVNVGDILEAWSNGRFPSVEHRVGLNEDSERFSTVNFLDAGPSLLIEAPRELVDEAHPSMYVPFLAGDFRANFEKLKRLGNIRKGVALRHVRRHVAACTDSGLPCSSNSHI